MIVYTSAGQEGHAGQPELIDGAFKPCVESPSRYEAVRAALAEAGHGPFIEPPDNGLDPVLAVHDDGFVDTLARAWALWVAEQGEDAHALPIAWPVGLPPSGRRKGAPPRRLEGRLGWYAFDAAAAIGPGTWRAALGAVSSALAAARAARAGRTAFALTRPPGHHAGAAFLGGYCYLNSIAISAHDATTAGARVAILDLDYHHGNGTQDIFYGRPDVLTISLHADPRDEYPYYWGHAEETGEGAGEGFNLNLPLPIGTDGATFAEALGTGLAKVRGFAPDLLLVALGLDGLAGDPISRFSLHAADYARAGAAVAGLRLPVATTLEGGYDLAGIGPAAAGFLTALQGG